MANGNENIADVGSRIAAVILDHIIIAVIYAVLTFPLFGAVMTGRGFGAFVVPYIIVLWVLPFLYYTFFEAYMKGQTPGKMAVKIKVVKVSGEPIDIGESLIRNILRVIDSIFVYLVGFIILSMSDKKQRLGDMAAGTVVVKA
ncbi:MAG: RDD family protein [Theionarchaea archaeon]|nr:RDD family protein [Theionarchaea archaeon]